MSNILKIKNVFMLQLYSKLAKYLQIFWLWSQNKDTLSEGENQSHIIPKAFTLLHQKKHPTNQTNEQKNQHQKKSEVDNTMEKELIIQSILLIRLTFQHSSTRLIIKPSTKPFCISFPSCC